jgi:hypothetical protein
MPLLVRVLVLVLALVLPPKASSASSLPLLVKG